MTVTLKNGQSYSASFITSGRKDWSGADTTQGISFFCTDAMLWFPWSEIKSISAGNGVEFRRDEPVAR